MRFNGNTVPTGRDATYSSDEVVRKDSEALFDTAFNDDQKKALNEFNSSDSSMLEIGCSLRIVEEGGESYSEYTLDKTAQEIIDAFPFVYIKMHDSNGAALGVVEEIQYGDGGYYIFGFIDNNLISFFAESADGRPRGKVHD